MKNKTNQVLDEISKVIIGKDQIIKKVLVSVIAGGHVLLEDVPGVGKTTLALSFSKALGLDYKRLQFTSDSVPSDVIGFSVYNKETGAFEYKPGAAMTNLLLADEINRTSSKTQSALLEVMEEGNVTVDGLTREVEKPFVVIATQNPAGSAGTQMLPNSQLDRFMVRLNMGYPDFESQVNILKERHKANPLDSVEKVITKEELLAIKDEAAQVYISDEIYRYITRLVEKTRNHNLVNLGISPRGALALCNAAKAYAYISGRDFVVPEDIKELAPDCFAHRLMLDPRARLTKTDEKMIITEIIQEVPTPEEEK